MCFPKTIAAARPTAAECEIEPDIARKVPSPPPAASLRTMVPFGGEGGKAMSSASTDRARKGRGAVSKGNTKETKESGRGTAEWRLSRLAGGGNGLPGHIAGRD